MMKSIKLGLLIGCTVSIICFWIIPEGKKLVIEWKELQRIKAVHRWIKDGGLKIVPKYKDVRARYEC